MNYNIEIAHFDKVSKREKTKYISDYVYWDARDKEDLTENLMSLNTQYFVENFIKQASGNGYINKNEISSVKFSDKKYRVIFNLSHPVTFTDFDGKEKITSEFVYVNCNDLKSYDTYVKYVKTELGEK